MKAVRAGMIAGVTERSRHDGGSRHHYAASTMTERRLPALKGRSLATGGAGAIWIAHFDTGDVSRINPQTGQTATKTHLQFPEPITTNGWRRFEPLGISFGAGRVWASSSFGYVAEVNPVTARLQRMVFTSSEVTSATTAGGLTWVADELDGVDAFAVGSDHVKTHHISWAGQPVDVETVGHGAGLIWALGTQSSYLSSLTDPSTVGVVTTLDPRTGPDRASVASLARSCPGGRQRRRICRRQQLRAAASSHPTTRGPDPARTQGGKAHGRHPWRALGGQPKRTAAAHWSHTPLTPRPQSQTAAITNIRHSRRPPTPRGREPLSAESGRQLRPEAASWCGTTWRPSASARRSRRRLVRRAAPPSAATRRTVGDPWLLQRILAG
jgi:hypothetical protein